MAVPAEELSLLLVPSSSFSTTNETALDEVGGGLRSGVLLFESSTQRVGRLGMYVGRKSQAANEAALPPCPPALVVRDPGKKLIMAREDA